MTNMWCIIDSKNKKNLINIKEDEFDNEIIIHITERFGEVSVKIDK